MNNQIIKKLIHFFPRYTITVFSCVLIIVLGITFLTQANPDPTTIGENISTTDFTASGTISLPNNSIIDAMTVDTITASNYLLLGGGQMTGNITFLGAQTVDGIDISTIPSTYLSLNGGTITGDLIVSNTISEGGTLLSAKYLGILNKAADSDKLDNLDSTYFTNADNLSIGTLPSGRIAGDYSGITGLGTVASGGWQGTAVGTQYGGTGLDWSAIAQGNLPFFSAEGTLNTLAPGTSGQFLKSQGTGADPTYTNVARTATFVVAANDSSTLSKQQADYVCDGTDDQIQIQQAIDALPTDGGKIVLLEGTYKISTNNSPISISSKTNITLCGQGKGTKISLDTGICSHIISASSSSGVIIENLLIDGTTSDGTLKVGIIFASVEDSRISHTWVLNCKGDGIENVNGSLNNIIAENIVKGNGRYGIYLYDSNEVEISQHVVISNNIVNNNSHGIFVSYANYVNIVGNICENNTNWGIHLCTAGDDIIDSNICTGNGDDGIYVTGSDRTIISNNYCQGNSAIGINVLQSEGAIIEGNVCLANTDEGIFINSDTKSSIIGNTCDNNLKGVYVTSCTLNTIIGNVVTNNTYEGLTIYTGSHQNTISGNLCQSNGRHGIQINAANDNNVIGNSIIDNSKTANNQGYGIRVEGASSRNNIQNNLVRKGTGNTHGYGIRIESNCPNNIVKNNDLYDASNIANLSNVGTGTFIYEQYSDLFMDALAVSATHVRSNEDLSEGIPNTFTIDAQPDIPRTLSGHFDAHAQITAYTIDIVGVDAKGNTVTEEITEADGWDWKTSNAFATITSIIMSARTGTGAGDTMDIGITDVLGLSNIIYATGDVYKIKKNNANATVATAQVSTTYDTYDMSVIGLGGADDFTIYYKSNLNIIE